MALDPLIMQYNVAQLLEEPIGSSRSYQLDETLNGVERLADRLGGSVRLSKTQEGVLVDAKLDVDAVLTCGRCLGEYPLNLTFDIEEEFFLIVDLDTGHSMSAPVDSEGEQIDEAFTLDLSEVVRQYIITNTPMKPLCSAECSGLCQSCGANLNLQECQCGKPAIDPRWGDLAGLLLQEQN